MKFSLITLAILICSCQKPVTNATAPQPKRDAVELSGEAQKNANVEIVVAKRVVIDQLIEAPGKLAWNDDKTVSIGAIAAGKVMFVYSRVGDTVKVGQVLARMHTHEVHDTKAALRSARAERERAESSLEQMKRNEDRMRRLLELKAVSQSQLEQAVMDRKTAESSARKAHADEDREVQHLTETLEIAAEVDEGAGHAHQHNEDEELVPIKASAAGTVVDRKISPGVVVNIGQETFTITDSGSLWCIANFPETSLRDLRVGLNVEVEVRAYPGRIFVARIARLGDTLDANTRTLMIRADLASQGVLKPEMLATIRLHLRGASVLSVPEAAVQMIEGKQTVFVEKSPGKFIPRSVEARIEDGRAVILSGLTEGERVAANGSYFLKGQLLREAGL